MSVDYSDLAPGVQEGEISTGWKQVGRIALGVVLVLAGFVMLVFPGQGVLTIIVGLNLIKPDNAIVRWLRKRMPGIPESGPIPKGAIAFGVFLFVVLGVVSALFGRDVFDWARDLVGV